MKPVGPHGQNDPFSRSNYPQNRTSVKTLPMEPVGPHGQNDNLQCQTIPGANIPMELVGPHGQNDPFSRPNKPQSSCPSRPKRPIFKVKRAPQQTFVKTLPIEPVRSHGQNNLFSRSNDSWSRPYLWSQLALTVKTTHFQGQTIPEADLTYGASWPSRPKRPIFKVKQSPKQTSVKTLPMEPVGLSRPKQLIFKVKRSLEQKFDLIFANILPRRPLRPYLWSQLARTAKTAHFQGQIIPREEPVGRHSQNILFSRSNDPQRRISTSFLPKFYRDVRLALPMEPVGLHGLNDPFSWSNDPRNSWPSRPKRPIFNVKRSPEKTSVKNLPMEPVGFQGQNDPFSRSNYPRSSWPSHPKRLIFKVKNAPEQTLPIEPVSPHGQNGPFSRSNDPRGKPPILPIFMCYKSMDFLVIQNSDLIFAKILPGRLLTPYLWSQLAHMAKTAHFQGQTIPEADLTYGASWPSRPKWPIFKVKRSPEQDLTYGASWLSRPKRPIFKVKRSPEQLALTAKMTHFQGQTIPVADLTCGASWPSRPNRPIFKVKQSPEQNQLALMTKMAHFEGQTIPRAGKLPPLPIFICYSSPSLLVIRNFDLIFAKNLLIRPLRPYLWSQLALRAKTSHFQGQTNPGADLTYRANWPSWPKRPIFKVNRSPKQETPTLPIFICYSSPSFLVIRNSDHIFAKILPGCSLRPYLWSQLAITAKTSQFQGQTIPEQSTEICGDPKFRWHLDQKFIWTSVKTLAMELVGHHSQNGPFSRSNEPRSSLRDFLVIQNSDFIFAKTTTSTSVKTLAMEPVGHHDQNDPFSWSNESRSK
ncbi:hypothetical protein H5410_024959 [Solanum commersonii]|uniref:Uncharacterized protein n=1 Tax=Solanum commersonii TaxID=4109 RepID=A0A9J5YRS0_SOLCO|nr:hypothetical protein H5410_024959 [Solanum commersonii]